MRNLTRSQQHPLLWLTGFALAGFFVLTYLAFHQPTTLYDDNMRKENRMSQTMAFHAHHKDYKQESQARAQSLTSQNSRLVEALLVMGGLGCH